MPAKKILNKPKPDGSHWFLNGTHTCGCRFRTDNELVWCSGINCPFVVTKAYFMMWYWYDDKTGVFIKLPF